MRVAEDSRAIEHNAVPLVCQICAASEWLFEADAVLRCSSCNAILPRRNNVIDCRGAHENTSLIEGWRTYYDEKAKVYSPSSDWWTLDSWRKHLFGSVLHDMPGKTVLD